MKREAAAIEVTAVPGKIYLEEICWKCQGEVPAMDVPMSQRCDMCNGRGSYLTTAGEQILDFMKHWLHRGDLVA